MYRVAFPLLGRSGWTGGLVYLKNTLRLINSRLEDSVEPWIFLSLEEDAKFGSELRPLVADRVIVDRAIKVAGRGTSLAKAIAIGRDATLERLLSEKRIDVVFESAGFYGSRFSIPIVSWLTDFQHRQMPEMFGRLNWWRRDIGYRMQISSPRTIMLSSNTARDDLEWFYPRAKGRGHVVRFAIDLDHEPFLNRGTEMRETYRLPERFFFLPNQFWRHKNHAVIVEALGRIATDQGLDSLPPVILTGQSKDSRAPRHFDRLMTRSRELGVEGHFRYLGLIPFEDVLALNASCHAIINPSRMEGWSTSIEEAKVFSTPLILSDIRIHREQAPDAHFFDWRSAESAADALSEMAVRGGARPSIETLRAEQGKRLDEHATALLATLKAAVRMNRQNGG